MKIIEIMKQVEAGNLDPEDAVLKIKDLFFNIVNKASTGIGSVDATEMHSEILDELVKT